MTTSSAAELGSFAAKLKQGRRVRIRMSVESLRTIEVGSRREWRNWLRRHHDSESLIWLVFHKRHKGKESISYDGAVEEALCFGWIDSIVKRLDQERYARKFTPRKPESRWSSINRQRYAKLKACGLLAAAGRKRAPTGRSGDAPRPSLAVIPSYIQSQFKANRRAWDYFEQLAPSFRRAYIAWIDSAKREETKDKRLREAIDLLASGRKLGLK